MERTCFSVTRVLCLGSFMLLALFLLSACQTKPKEAAWSSELADKLLAISEEARTSLGADVPSPEEVAPGLDKYLDNAYLAGLPWVHIIHGKGMGILKAVVRDFLKDHPLVKSFRPGVQGEGDDGVTVVTLMGQQDGS